ncbi:uncharacterized protein TNCT_229371 [Trichonephila clavata]|uniref:Gustatory receptor n=1 Tax=Trichonephila clavata TaxID=2740835 RepID=A0A8X6GIP0_TRICU|nr:uncharacterized protein TNCT_229371 [Trichonephila clavata]
MNREVIPPLKWIVRSFYFICIILPDSEKESKLRRISARILDIFIVSYLIFLICSDLSLSVFELNSAPFGFIIAALSGDFCSLSIRLVLIFKRQRIANMLQNIFSLYRKLEMKNKAKWHGGSLIIVFTASWIIPLLLFTKNILFVILTEDGIKISQKTLFFGNHTRGKWIFGIVFLFNVLLNQQLYALPGFSVGLCYYSYKILTLIIQKMDRNLKKKTEINSLFTSYLEFDEKITNCIKEIENALSLMLLFLYTYLISCIFIVVTLLIRSTPHMKITEYMLFNVATFIVAFAAFYALSFQSVNVHRAAVEIERTVYKMCSKMSSSVNKKGDAVRFLLLTTCDTFSSKVLISGWGLFVLNQNFILQTTGAIISYGTIIAQLGSDTDTKTH